ncbi:NUDIX hydrolase domain-like protein [Dactylonectria macrodidyma]|uniref:NUDIX hydrolase domain-like protein n=1 Tax=Dactylonectria macrodidyma TaxID=307937 RepID=A0A9P9J4E2_9HYPO|nr:NUDIX hydrolase domain-like protein [Dactylonectria macrodidyma]
MAEASQNEEKPSWSNFTFDDSVAEWNVPGAQWLDDNNKTWNGIAAGALVFDDQDRVLLVRRAEFDSMPLLWEIPGGGVDPEDPTILHGCARELWEEAGLKARHIKHIIVDGMNGKPGAVFTNRTGQRFYCKFSFEVEVADTTEVTLDPNEHVDYIWATQEEVQRQRVGDREIPIANKITMILLNKGFEKRLSNKN